mmetsp:Transcript_7683/g.10026  ORF Transcript_7683/g.10026 Transcript_7683/m.10026 type:complete len:564 (+) Transcript_7683:204-1895(+)
MAKMDDIVTPQELSKLIPMLPLMLYFLQDEDPKKSGIRVGRAAQQNLSRSQVLLEFLIESLLAGVSGDEIIMSTNSVKSIFYSFDPNIVAECVVLVLKEAEPPLLDSLSKKVLIDAAIEKGTESTKNFRKPLRKLNPTSFYVLGELASFIHAGPSKGVGKLCTVLSRIILLDPAEPKYHPIAASLLEALSRNSSALFGVPRRQKLEHIKPFGYRQQALTHFHQAAALRRTQHLKMFYRIRDSMYVPAAEQLFKYHGFVDIAEGIYKKYSMLPEEWKHELISLKRANVELPWFNPDKIKFLNESTTSFPTIAEHQGSNFVDSKRPKEDMVIDELVDSEMSYYITLRTFLTSYVYEIRNIAEGRLGVDAQSNLGLSKKDVNYIFGERLEDIVSLLKKMVVKMEVLMLVREPTVDPIGRAGILANILLEMYPEMKAVYGPYMSSYSKVRVTIEQAEAAQEKASKGKSNSIYGKNASFMGLWQEVSSAKAVLKSSQNGLQSLLITPVARLPRYNLFLSRVAKQLGEGHPAHKLLMQAVEVLKSVTSSVDEDIKTTENFQLKFFGELK